MNGGQFQTLLIGQLVLQAEHEALLATIQHVAARLPTSSFDAAGVGRWYQSRLITEFEKVVFSIEDTDPAIAAALQARIDRTRQGQPPQS